MKNMEIRERAKTYGVQVLDNTELLSCIIPPTYAEKLTKQHSSLTALAQQTIEDLSQMGCTELKAISVLACIELGKRLAKEKVMQERPDFSFPEAIAEYFMPDMRYLKQEHFCAAFLSMKNGLIAYQTISIGTIDRSDAKARDVFAWALRYNAASVVLLHNHPSGDPTPSREDIVVTQKIARIGEMMEIPVLDHIVIGDGIYNSLREIGYI